MIILLSILFFLIINSIFMGYKVGKVIGDSMEPTLSTGDIVFYERASDVTKNDIVILNLEDDILVKRIVATPGDSIYYNDYRFNVNKPIMGSSSKYTLQHDEYFVIGDNLGVSLDSRSFGPIKFNQIIGVMLFKIYERNE